MYEFGAEERAAADRILASGNLFRYMDEAHEAELFERELAGKLGAAYGLATSSGTGALICGLAALGVGPGDEVLIPAYAYIADVIAVLAVGAVPVVCEIDETLAMDPDEIASKATARTRAVMPVHMCGLPGDMDRIMAAARALGLAVIEDSCQAIGARFRGRPLGTFGDMGAFSFNQAKIITAGEGGALLTSDARLHDRAFAMHDASSAYDGHQFGSPVFAGLAFRMNEISAGILRVQLTRLDDILAGLRAIRARIGSVLEPVAGMTIAPENDPDGSSGSITPVICADEALAGRFQAAANEIAGIWAYRGIALGYSFFEWELLHERRGAHHALRNPLLGDVPVQKPTELSRSRELLDRVVFLGYPLDLTDEAIERLGQVAAEG